MVPQDTAMPYTRRQQKKPGFQTKMCITQPDLSGVPLLRTVKEAFVAIKTNINIISSIKMTF